MSDPVPQSHPKEPSVFCDAMDEVSVCAPKTATVDSPPSAAPNEEENRLGLYALDAEGNKLRFGTNNKRTKLFDSAGNQITKSCHVCQDQHVKFKCKASDSCSFSFCDRCLEKYHETLSVKEAMECCPVCRGVCSCRACLRKMWKPHLVLEQHPKQKLEFAEEILKCCGPFIAAILKHYDQEASNFGMKLEDIDVCRTLDSSITCDRCSTSIPDLHFCCESCAKEVEGGTEICMDCVSECRTIGRFALQSALVCRTCSSKLVLARMVSKEMLKALRTIAETYGSGTDRPVLPMLSYPTSDFEKADVNVDLHLVKGSDDVKLICIVKKPDDLEQNLGHFTRQSEKVTKDCETVLEGLESKIEWRDAGYGKKLRCVDASDCTSGDFQKLMRLSIWRGEPLIVKNVKGMMDWRPQTMSRVFVDRRSRSKQTKKRGRPSSSNSDSDDSSSKEVIGPDHVCVIHCGPKTAMSFWKQSEFFKIYERGNNQEMHKIKDWPQDDTFQEKLTRHYQDFVEMLPFAVYTNPVSGMMNMTTALPEYRCRPDLGPKSYLATGRVEERNNGTDSVTKLHLDMADAMNILVHTQTKDPNESNSCSAVWNIISRTSIARVTEYLKDPDAISEKKTYLTQQDRKTLIEDRGVHMWTFEQFENEAVYVPSGCPHQVRNTRSCFKVAIDFFPPESAAVVMDLVQYRRQFAKRVKNDEDKDVADALQSYATMMYASVEAYRVKKTGAEFHAVDEKRSRKWRKVEEKDLQGNDELMEVDEDRPRKRPSKAKKKRRTRSKDEAST